MPIKYEDVKPWGRSYEEYVRMFSLTPGDLRMSILGCGDGPASFNAEASERGGRVISLDPIYRFSAGEIRQKIRDNHEEIIDQTCRNAEKFIWDGFGSMDDWIRHRMAAMSRFLDDFEEGKRQGRYVCGELPSLPFGDRAFDLALCSHLLFLYSDNLSLGFHLKSVRELCRVAREARIFPLLDANANRSTYVDTVIRYLGERGINAVEEKVDYEFQRGGNTMLRITPWQHTLP